MRSRWRSLRIVLCSSLVLLLVGCGPLLLSLWRTAQPSSYCQSTREAPLETRYDLAVSSLVESAGMVYALVATLTTDGPDSGQIVSTRLSALRASDGTLLWQQPAFRVDDLLADQGALYLSSPLEARRASDGMVLWHDPEVSARYDLGAHLVLDQGILYTSSVDRPLAVRSSDGQVLWQAAPGPAYSLVPSRPFLYSHAVVNNEIVFVGLLNGPVTALRESSETVLWQTVLGGTIAPYPIAEAFGQVYVSAGQGVQVLDASDGHLEGTLPGLSTGLFAPATVVDGVLYTTDGQTAYAVQVPENTVLWHTPLRSELEAPTVVQGFVFFPGASTLLQTTDGSPLRPSTPASHLTALGLTGGYQAMSGFRDDCSPSQDQPVTISALHEPDQSLLWSTTLPIG